MFADLILPPGCRLRIEYVPDRVAPNVTISLFRADHWLGEVSASTARVSAPGELQKIVDHMTVRGVRELRIMPNEAAATPDSSPPTGWRLTKCRGGPLDGALVGLPDTVAKWEGAAIVQSHSGEDVFMGPPPGGLYVLDGDENALLWIGETSV